MIPEPEESAEDLERVEGIEGYEGAQFRVVEVERKAASALMGVVDPSESTVKPIILYLRLQGSTLWHRFFLQAGVAYWHFWDDDIIQDEMANLTEDGFEIQDYAEEIGGLPQMIGSAAAGPNAESGWTEIMIQIGSSTLVVVSDPSDEDGDIEVRFVSN